MLVCLSLISFLHPNFILPGYGNAAGLLARKGLMGSPMARKPNLEPDYSEDSEDSDTEDYKAVKDDINPVTGAAAVMRYASGSSVSG